MERGKRLAISPDVILSEAKDLLRPTLGCNGMLATGFLQKGRLTLISNGVDPSLRSG